MPARSDRAARLDRAASRHHAIVRSRVADGTGWRWRVSWRAIEVGAWNDIDGVAVVADIGPFDDWVGLAGHPPDPSEVEALDWAVVTLSTWLQDPAASERIAGRTRGSPSG
jgi:hypothetical protein